MGYFTHFADPGKVLMQHRCFVRHREEGYAEGPLDKKSQAGASERMRPPRLGGVGIMHWGSVGMALRLNTRVPAALCCGPLLRSIR
jgi:hypothetical protein